MGKKTRSREPISQRLDSPYQSHPSRHSTYLCQTLPTTWTIKIQPSLVPPACHMVMEQSYIKVLNRSGVSWTRNDTGMLYQYNTCRWSWWVHNSWLSLCSSVLPLIRIVIKDLYLPVWASSEVSEGLSDWTIIFM